MRLLLLVSAICAMTACRSEVAEQEYSPPTTQFALLGSDSAAVGATLPPTIRTDGHRVEILGVVELPSKCHTLRAKVSYERPRVVTQIAASHAAGSCAPVPARFTYRIVQPLSPGEYSVSVVFQGPEPGTPWWPLTEQKVTVGSD